MSTTREDKLSPTLLFGAAYYHEYQPYERLAADLDLMAAAAFSVIRVGESVWSTWEPQEGVFDLDWLEPIIDNAYARGISVVIGTPSYAVPPWLRLRYPETTAQRRSGEPIPYGGRQNADFTNPTYRGLVERYCPHVAPTLLTVARTGEVHQDAPHHSGGYGEEVDAVLPLDLVRIHQPEVGFMN